MNFTRQNEKRKKLLLGKMKYDNELNEIYERLFIVVKSRMKCIDFVVAVNSPIFIGFIL